MLNYLQKHAAIMTAVVALVVSACTSVGLTPLPNVYKDAETNVERTLVSVKAFGAAQETLLQVCTPAKPESLESDICVKLIPVEQTLRPAVRAAARIGAEYSDIDARIKEVGPNAPAEWLLLAAETAGRLSDAYDPVKADVDAFVANAGELVN
jgi:hypothetical protein